MSVHESILLEKRGLTEAGVPPHSTSIARAEVLEADSHSSPPALKETIFSKTYELKQKRKPTGLLEGKKKILKKHMLGNFLGLKKKI